MAEGIIAGFGKPTASEGGHAVRAI